RESGRISLTTPCISMSSSLLMGERSLCWLTKPTVRAHALRREAAHASIGRHDRDGLRRANARRDAWGRSATGGQRTTAAGRERQSTQRRRRPAVLTDKE